MIRVDKRKTSRTMLGPSFTRTRNQSCGGGGRRIRNSSLRHSPNERTECKCLGSCSQFLSESLDRFRWIFCQLEVLRDCLPSSVRRTLMELPESLDETYERILMEIKKPNRDLARRVLQCLVVATRPLRVAELAEVLAVDFDDAEGIPRLEPDWRWEEQELALLSECSSLIAIVEAGNVKASDSDPDDEANDSTSEVEARESDYDVKSGHS